MNAFALITRGHARLQQQLAGLERAQAHSPRRDRADRIAHLRTALRRASDTVSRSFANDTRAPFETR